MTGDPMAKKKKSKSSKKSDRTSFNFGFNVKGSKGGGGRRGSGKFAS